MLRDTLAVLGRQGRWVLLAGLVLGVGVPQMGAVLLPAIAPLIGLTLFVAALRVGPQAVRPGPGGAVAALWPVAALQLALPLAVGGLLALAGWLDTPTGNAIVLMLAAAPITGVPGLAVMTGADAGLALRQLVLGTALLPLTALPVFLLLPVFPDLEAVAAGALRLLLVIGLATGGALALRHAAPGLAHPRNAAALDGVMALSMAVAVTALMGALGPALARGAWAPVAWLLALSFALNLGGALGTWALARRALPRHAAAALAIVAGNRNMALFLAAMPPETAAPLMLFVGCYQIPMYLTPLTLPRLLGPLTRPTPDPE